MSERPETVNGVQFVKLIGDARAFRQSAWLLEEEIDRLGAMQGVLSPLGGSNGWPSHSVWESLKTASHFNLATALELQLKCLLRLAGVIPPGGSDGHRLAVLYNRFGDDGRMTVAKLEQAFQEAAAEFPFALVAFLRPGSPDDAPAKPDDRELASLADFFAYMDEDVDLWRKRYAWEQAAAEQWQHYLDDLRALFAFFDKTERLTTRMAREQGLVS